MHPLHEFEQAITRRHFFRRGGLGLGTAALASMLPAQGDAGPELKPSGGIPGLPHFAPKANLRDIFRPLITITIC